jgi:uroporphyrinogen decarboxylase
MLSRERVIDVIEHRRPDRVPIYGWVRENLADEITAAFGSVEAFEDHYEFDLAHLFGGPRAWDQAALEARRTELGRDPTPPEVLDLPVPDPDDRAAYRRIVEQVRHHKEARGRFVYVQTPGYFEGYNDHFGIENHLLYLLQYPDELRELYRRRVDWAIRFAHNCLDLGVDMIHISDDWGGQTNLLFSPEIWWDMIHPCHRAVADAVKARGGYVSLHSDGNIGRIVDGILDIGYHVVHPWQESAGMSLERFKAEWSRRFTVMGGLDVQSTLGFGDRERLVAEIERVMRLGAGGGLLFCTTHFVQAHCSIEELTAAYDSACDWSRTLGRS